MTVSIILVAYHGDDWLPGCIDTLRDAGADGLHLILLDNAGNSVIGQLDLGQFDAEVLKTPHPMGFADANNYALVNASRLEDIVLFLNQDTLSEPGWIDACLSALRSDKYIGAISPLITTYDGEGWDPSFMDCLDATQQQDVRSDSIAERVIDVENAPAAALLVKRDVLAKTGPFDPIFGSYYEDYDLCRRIRTVGYRIGFAADARLAHYSGSTTTTEKKERARMRQIIRNRVIYRARDERRSRAVLLAHHFLVDTPRRIARGLMGTPSSQPPLVTLKATFDLVKLLPRLISAGHDRSVWYRYLEEIGWSRLRRFSNGSG